MWLDNVLLTLAAANGKMYDFHILPSGLVSIHAVTLMRMSRLTRLGQPQMRQPDRKVCSAYTAPV